MDVPIQNSIFDKNEFLIKKLSRIKGRVFIDSKMSSIFIVGRRGFEEGQMKKGLRL